MTSAASMGAQQPEEFTLGYLQKCGEVYICDKELYVVECGLCEDSQLCTLAEFPEHIEIWHTIGEQETIGSEQMSEYEGTSCSPEIQTSQESDQESVGSWEPFEQVLIADVESTVEDNQSLAEEKSDRVLDPTQLDVKNQIQFGLNQPLLSDRLSSEHTNKLIDLYQEQPRLWNQSHSEFNEVRLVRASWEEITTKWNQFCKQRFSTTDIRIRVSTLCQRYMKERERLENGDACGGGTKFAYYEKLKFLDEQQTLVHRRLMVEQHNSKLLEIYQHFPILWCNTKRHLKRTAQRREALRNISTALKLCGIHLSPLLVQRRLQALRRCFRAEKIRKLQCKIDGREFETDFKHFTEMQFLENHIDPFACSFCGKVFESFGRYREHVESENHDFHNPEEEEEETEEATDDSGIALSPTHTQPSSENTDDTPSHTNVELEPAAESTLHTSSENDFEIAEDQPQSNVPNVGVAGEEVQSIGLQSNDSNPTNTDAPKPCIAKVECGSLSYNLEVGPDVDAANVPQDSATLGKKAADLSSATFARLTVKQTRILIQMYSQYPQLWDPNHLDFNSRKLRRIAWRTLTAQFNKMHNLRYEWKTLQRKLTDHLKYYKREKQRTEDDCSSTKWCFYDDFVFMNDVIPITDELHKVSQHRDNNLKIIEVYKSHPQLWDTRHPEFTKRKHRQYHIESIFAQLQECNMQITLQKLKQRLVEYRCNYRLAKQQRITALKRKEPFVTQFQFYDALQFLDPHVAPFDCSLCSMSFKRFSDFSLHERKQHQSGKRRKPASAPETPLENVCHICGIKFTLRSNLVCHLKRHLGGRTHACTTCGKSFYNKSALAIHERSHTKHYACVCEHCGRSFVNTSKMNQHMKRHRNQRDHKCDQCGKAFFSAFERDRHMRRHLNIRDKVCPVCGKSFVVGSSYYAHLMLHSSTKRYACSECEMRFAQYPGLYKHRKKHHPKE